MYGQICGAIYTLPDPDGTWELDYIVCGHWLTYRGPIWLRQVPVQGPRTNPDQWPRGDLESEGT